MRAEIYMAKPPDSAAFASAAASLRDACLRDGWLEYEGDCVHMGSPLRAGLTRLLGRGAGRRLEIDDVERDLMPEIADMPNEDLLICVEREDDEPIRGVFRVIAAHPIPEAENGQWRIVFRPTRPATPLAV